MHNSSDSKLNNTSVYYTSVPVDHTNDVVLEHGLVGFVTYLAAQEHNYDNHCALNLINFNLINSMTGKNKTIHHFGIVSQSFHYRFPSDFDIDGL